MDRRQALAIMQKAGTIDTTAAANGLLNPEQSRSFIQTIKDKSAFGKAIRLERRKASSGEINKITSGSRLIRAKAENADDGYRAGVSFPVVEYVTRPFWLPWEVTENTYHENIEGELLEAKILDEMTQVFALDWDDLDVNGDEDAPAGPDQAFLKINNGLLKLCEESADVHRINGAQINAGEISIDHFAAAAFAMPNKYLNSGRLRWFMSPSRWVSWVLTLTERETGGGDAAITGRGLNPLGIPPFMGASSSDGNNLMPGVPHFPDDRIILADPQNFVRVVSWDVLRYKVTPDTDWELATRLKRGYLFHVQPDFVIAEEDAVVDIHGLAPVIGEGSGSGSGSGA